MCRRSMQRKQNESSEFGQWQSIYDADLQAKQISPNVSDVYVRICQSTTNSHGMGTHLIFFANAAKYKKGCSKSGG